MRRQAARYARQQPAQSREAARRDVIAMLSTTPGRGEDVTVQQEQEQGQSAKRARSVAWGAGVAGVGFVAAVVFYEVLFGTGYRNNYFWWARAAEGALIGGGALLAWHVGRARLAAVVGLVTTVVLLAVGIALPATELWAMGQSPVIWGLLVPFAVRAVTVKQGGRDASEANQRVASQAWN